MTQTTTITFRADLAESTRRGVPCPVPPLVRLEIDPAAMSAGDRLLLAGRLNQAGEVCSRRESDGYFVRANTALTTIPESIPAIGYQREEAVRLVTAPEPTLAGLLEAIRAEEQAIATYDDRQAAREAAKEAEYVERFREVFAARKLHRVDNYSATSSHDAYSIMGPAWPWISGSSACQAYLATPEVQEWLAQIKRANDATMEAAYAAVRERQAFRQAELARKQAEQEEWIAQHGSRWLKRLVAEEMEYSDLYDDELAAWEQDHWQCLLASEHPDWMDLGLIDVASESITRLTTASPADFALLDAARQMCPTARLAKIDETGRILCVATFECHLIGWPGDE